MSELPAFGEAQWREERRRAMRALLMRPLLSASGPDADDYARVRLHVEWLREWLRRNTGWRLDLDSEVTRLRKTPVDGGDGTRPARDRRGTPFTRRQYVLLCLALAALERCDRQTTLGQLAESIAGGFAADPELAAAGLLFDLVVYEHRKDLIAAIRYLLDLRIVVRVQGDEEQYLAKQGDVLYNVERPALARMPGFHRGPSMVTATSHSDRVAALIDEPAPTHDEGKNRRLRHRLTRRLLDDPFILFDDLDPEERAYLAWQRPFLVDEVHDATGLISEVRREGIAMADDRSELSDVAMPEDGTDGHATLLLAEFLADHARRSQEPAPLAALHEHIAALAAIHGAYWRGDARQPGAEVHLVRAALERLEALGLVRRSGETVRPRAPIARYGLSRRDSQASDEPSSRARQRKRSSTRKAR